ncbi:MAG: ATP-dependent sacrificial sulfur transferase LarE [bacterium]|nr:ATP-dependent sacrificial sulfur transferase LarE [bacterium]
MKMTKLDMLRKRLLELDRVAVAYSGGVDSTFLLSVAGETLGKDRVLAVTASSAIHSKAEIRDAKELTRMIGVRHLLFDPGSMKNRAFLANRPDRCYTCKKGVFLAVRRLASENGMKTVADGTNADDASDYRPGRRALKELGIVSPLAEAGLTKREIRSLSRKRGLPTWNRPALACLATRIPYGERITAGALRRVDAAETALRDMGFIQVRVRDHGGMARIEIAPSEMNRALKPGLFPKIVKRFKAAGYHTVALDLEGYRTGSLNEALRNRT